MGNSALAGYFPAPTLLSDTVQLWSDLGNPASIVRIFMLTSLSKQEDDRDRSLETLSLVQRLKIQVFIN